MDYNTLAGYFRSGSKAPDELQVGVEWEKIGIDRQTGRAIPYSGPRGVRAILEALEAVYAWKPVRAAGGEPIALKKGPFSITLEPGGQIELSGQKAPELSMNAQELARHLMEIHAVSEPLDIVWLGIGAQPFSRHAEIEWTPKERYAVMRERLKNAGTRTFSMMKETASVQVSLDFTDEHDAVQKLRLAMALSPVLTAVFANSPLESGRRSEFLSRRAHIWLDTAPERSGVLWDVFDPGYTLDDYVRYALGVPLLFIQREERWLSPPPMSFADFLRDGWNGHEAVPEDWELHLTSLFTEARLKKYVEIRGIDCQSAPMGMAAVAFVKGLFYSKDSAAAAWRLLKDLSLEERKELRQTAPRLALRTPLGGQTLLETARALEEMASSGLAPAERRFLAPLSRLLREGRCPAERLLECGCDRTRSTIDWLVSCAGIGSGAELIT